MEEIKSQIIGVLRQDEKYSDWWESDEIEIPFFKNKRMKIIYSNFNPKDDKRFIIQADQALNNFFKIGNEERILISELVYKNYLESLEMIEYDEDSKELQRIKDQNQIWNYVYPKEIYLARRQ